MYLIMVELTIGQLTVVLYVSRYVSVQRPVSEHLRRLQRYNSFLRRNLSQAVRTLLYY